MTTEQERATEPLTLEAAAAEPSRLLLHMPVDIRSMSLMVLAGLAILFVLHWAKAVFIPVMVGVLFSYAFSPIVNWLELKRVPRWLGAAAVLLSVLGALGGTAYSLSDNAVEAGGVAAGGGAKVSQRDEGQARQHRQHAGERAKRRQRRSSRQPPRATAPSARGVPRGWWSSGPASTSRTTSGPAPSAWWR